MSLEKWWCSRQQRKKNYSMGEAIKTSFIGSLGIRMSAECSSMGLRILTHLGLFQEAFPTETNLKAKDCGKRLFPP